MEANAAEPQVLSHEDAMNDLLGIPKTVVDTPSPVTPEIPTPAVPVGEATPAPVTPEQPEKPKPAEGSNEPDYTSYLATISEGTVNSEDDFKAILQKSGSVTSLESQITDLTTQLASLKAQNPFANDYTKQLNELYASGADKTKIEAFTRINQLGDINELSSYDALIFDLQDKNKLTREEADTLLNSKYKLNPEDHDENETAVAKIQMKIDGDAAKERLAEYKASFEVATPVVPEVAETPEQIAQKEQDFLNKATPVVKSIEQELPSYFKAINVNGKQGADAVTIELPVPAEIQKAVSEQILTYAKEAGVDVSDPEVKNGLSDYAKNLTKLAMFDAWIIDASNKREEALRAEFHNPDVINRGKDNPANAQAETPQSMAAEVARSY